MFEFDRYKNFAATTLEGNQQDALSQVFLKFKPLERSYQDGEV